MAAALASVDPAAVPQLASELSKRAAQAARLLKAMANEKRLMILCTLSQGERSVGDLNQDINLSQSALSQHLAVLRADGLVRTRRESQTIYYSVVEGPALALIQTLYREYCG
jgi:ArsR family transcriptional regulator, virulence genes transcriptional regulator